MSGRKLFCCKFIRSSEHIFIKNALVFFLFDRIFTSQLGKKSSLDQIKKHLTNIRHIDTELCQGNTMRWAIAWTFDEMYQFPSECQSRKAFQALKVFSFGKKTNISFSSINIENQEEKRNSSYTHQRYV